MPDESNDPALVARGARHVRVGLALGALGALTMATVALVSRGPGNAIGVTGWLGAVLTQAVLVAAFCSGSRIARVLYMLSAFGGIMGILALAFFQLFVPDVGMSANEIPVVLFIACMAMSAAGSTLLTVSPAATAWFNARREMFAARRKARSLAQWRAATPGHGKGEPR